MTGTPAPTTEPSRHARLHAALHRELDGEVLRPEEPAYGAGSPASTSP